MSNWDQFYASVAGMALGTALCAALAVWLERRAAHHVIKNWMEHPPEPPPSTPPADGE